MIFSEHISTQLPTPLQNRARAADCAVLIVAEFMRRAPDKTPSTISRIGD